MKQRVLLTGSDAIDLLHRISTVNTRALALNEKNPGLILNPQGKIMSYFEVTLKETSALEIDFDENFLELLDQYTFGERYKIESLPASTSNELSELDRIQKMIPRSGNEFQNNGETNPLEVNLRNAIHDNKGCYPGQEVIEKIISLGSPPRKLCLLKGNASKVPAPLLDPTTQTEVGVVTSAAEGYALAIVRRTHLKENLTFETKEKNTLTLQRIS